MMKLRRSGERGHADHGWLDTRHSFSFADYHDPDHMGFRTLRVLNDDRVAAGQGFGTHGHRDMEIVSYVLEGALEHRDSMGTGSVLRPGHVQRMTAGTGVTHSEFNHSASEPVHFLQIWIRPSASGLTPGYEEAVFSRDDKRGRLRLVVSPDGEDGSLSMNQQAWTYACVLEQGDSVAHTIAPGRGAWVQIARGEATVNGEPLAEGDGAALEDETIVSITTPSEAELLLFELA